MKGLVISRITGMIMLLMFVVALFILVFYGDDLGAILALILFVVMTALFVVGLWLLIETDLFATKQKEQKEG